MRISGQCHCGAVAYEAEIDPAEVSICHCTDCQKLTGSPYRVTVATAAENIRQTGAAPACYVKKGDSGRNRLQYFCGTCGSPVFVTGEGDAARTWGIRWGSIDQRRELRPTRQSWCGSAIDWARDITFLPE